MFDEEVEEKNEEEKETVAVLENKPIQKTENRLAQEKLKLEENPIIKPEKNESVKLLMDCGISENVAVQLAEGRETEYLREKIVLANAHSKYVKNKAGFIVEAIKGNWQNADIVKMKQEEERRHEEQQHDKQKKKLRNLLAGYEAFKKKVGFEQYEKKPDHEKKELQSEFLSSVNDAIRSIYQNKTNFGFEDGFFRSFFMQRVNIPSLETYLLAQDVVLSDEEREMMKVL